YYGGIQASPDRLGAVDDRLMELNRLKRKYGDSVAAALGTLAQLVGRRGQLRNRAEHCQVLDSRVRQALDEYGKESSVLGDLRHGAASKFERAVNNELKDVSLGAARFSVRRRASHT